MIVFRNWLVLPLISLTFLFACVPSIRAEKKHPAEEKGIKSTNGDVETSIKFVNKSKQTIKIYWIDYEGERKLYETVKDGDSYDQEKTFLTHPWLVTDEEDNAWYIYFPDAQPRTVEIVAPEKK